MSDLADGWQDVKGGWHSSLDSMTMKAEARALHRVICSSALHLPPDTPMLLALLLQTDIFTGKVVIDSRRSRDNQAEPVGILLLIVT